MNTCHFCGREMPMPCMNTRDCKDNHTPICYGGLIVAGGGEYTSDQMVNSQLRGRLPSRLEYHQQVRNGDETFIDETWGYIQETEL